MILSIILSSINTLDSLHQDIVSDIVDGMTTSKYFIVCGMMVFMVIVLIEFYSNYLVISLLNFRLCLFGC